MKRTLPVQIVDNKEFSNFERVTIWYGGLGILIGFLSMIAAVVAGYFVYHQWQEMNQQTGFMNRAAIQARQDSASTSESVAKRLSIMQGQLRQQQLAEQIDQRAWVGFIRPEYTFNLTESYKAALTYTNVGKTPATHVSAKMAVIEKTKDYENSFADIVYTDKALDGGTLIPNSTGTIHKYRSSTWPGQQNDLDMLKSGDRRLYIFALITYSDVFGNAHWTHFCSLLGQDLKTGEKCEIYNDSDRKRE
jgi:hypothetical protein